MRVKIEPAPNQVWERYGEERNRIVIDHIEQEVHVLYFVLGTDFIDGEHVKEFERNVAEGNYRLISKPITEGKIRNGA